MPITFNCPGCGKGYTVPDAVGGKSSKCRACGAAVKIPLSSQAAAPMPAAVEAPSAPARSGSGFPIKKIALVAVAFLVVVALGYGGYSLLSGGGSAGMKFMPDNTRVLVSVRPGDYMKSGVWAEIKKEAPEVDKVITEGMKDAGFQLEDISQILVGVGDYTKEDAIFAVEFKKAVKLDDFISFAQKKAINGGNKKLEESKVGSYTIKGDKEVSLCQVNDKLIIGGQPAAVKTVLERDKKPAFTEGLQKALKDADLSQTVSVAVDVKAIGSDPAVSGMAKGANIDVGSVEAAAINVNITSDVNVNAIAQCKDAKTAEDYRKMAEGGVLMVKKALGEQMPKDVMAILDALKIKDKGSQLTAEVSLKVSPLIPLAKQVIGAKAEKSFSTVGQEIGGPVGGPPGDFNKTGKVIGKVGGKE